jgi:hypothetical protein
LGVERGEGRGKAKKEEGQRGINKRNKLGGGTAKRKGAFEHTRPMTMVCGSSTSSHWNLSSLALPPPSSPRAS